VQEKLSEKLSGKEKLSEKRISDLILGEHPMMFRNPQGYCIACSPKALHKLKTGGFLVDRGQPMKFGLQPGSSDMIGWEPVVVTQEMVGKTVAIFQSIEIKTEHDRLSKEQRAWNRAVSRDGGIVAVWHDRCGVVEILRGDKIV